MSRLSPCPACHRHVRVSSSACPFCGTSLSAAAPEPAEPPRGISRTAVLAFGAALVGSATLGCSSETSTGTTGGGSSSSVAASTAESTSTTGGVGGAGGQGGKAAGAGGAGGQGGQGGAGGSNGTGMGGIAPPYGSPPFESLV